MITNRSTMVLAVCLIGLTIFPACLDIETTSTVNSNGSILRTVTFEGDSTSIYRGDFPAPIDSSWDKNIQKLGDRDFRLTASRLFNNVEEMNESFGGTSGKTLRYHFQFERNFQWFFTTYRFEEENMKYVQFDSIPLTDYVSPSEIESWKRHEVDKEPFPTKGDSLAWISAEPRFQQWESRNTFERIFGVFLDGVRAIHNPSLTHSSVIASKDTLFRASEQSLELGNIDTLGVIFSGVLRNPQAVKAWRLKAEAIRQIKERRYLNFAEDTFVTNVIMPGLIVASNARTIEGNKATWRDFSDYARILGYTMWVESRQVNWWAVILTGIIVLLLAALLVAFAFRRRRLALP